MDIQKILDDLDLIEQVIPDYSAGRRKGLTDDETEKAAGGAVTKAIEALEELQEQNEVLADTVNMLSPLMMENRELRKKQTPTNRKKFRRKIKGGMQMTNLEPCPKCKGEIDLYSCTSLDKPYNCFARCKKCKTEYPMPEAKLKAHGARIHPSSIKKAERLWNERAKGESSC